jgi:hypothetical protein
VFWKTGARIFRDTTSTIQADDTLRQPWLC